MWYFFFFKQKTAYEMRISDWSSDVCSSDLGVPDRLGTARVHIRDCFGIVPDLLHGLSEDRKPLGIALGVGLPHRLVHPRLQVVEHGAVLVGQTGQRLLVDHEIGRASGRERVCPYV